jgi:hypothetical protein
MKCFDVYNLFFEPGEVTEIRSYGVKGKNKAWSGWAAGEGLVFGYFDNAEDFGKAAEGLDAAGAGGVYFVLNPVNPDLLARSANRLKAAGAKMSATSDKDILCLRWLYVDLDPERPSGISSTDDELAAAIAMRNKISKWLKGKGWGQGIPAMSGNGAHLLMRLPDLAPTDEQAGMLRDCLAALGAKFDQAGCKVDRKNFNPSRICKVYGTTARKGDHTKTRPHRLSFVEPKYMEA